MKKFALLFAVMISMAQMSAATNDAAVNNEATNAETPAAAVAAAEDDNNSTSLLGNDLIARTALAAIAGSGACTSCYRKCEHCGH